MKKSEGTTVTIESRQAQRRKVKMKENEIGKIILDAALTVQSPALKTV